MVDVDAEIAYWAIVDQSARVTGQSWVITIPKAQRIDASAKEPWRKLANDLANEVATRARADYLRIRDLWSEGRRRAAFTELRALIEQPSWRFADGKTQAEAYRSLASWSYWRDRDATATDAYRNDPTAQQEAQRIAEDWLDEPSLFTPMLPWLVERELIADANKFANRMIAAVKSIDEPNAATDSNLIITTIRLLLSDQKIEEARQILSQFEQFIASHAPDAVTYWRARLLIAEGELDRAADAVEHIRSPASCARLSRISV